MPGRRRDLVARLGEHAAPAREGRPDAEAEERQGGFCQDSATHAQRGDHDQRSQDVGQDLGEHDAQVAVAQDAGGLDVALALQGQDLGAGDAAGVGPAGEAERDDQAGQAGPEDRHDGERKDQRRDRQHQVGEAAHDIVPPAAPVAGGEAQSDADQAVADLADDADAQRDAGAVEDARVDVAALGIGAEGKFPAGRDLGIHQVGVHHRVGKGEPRRQDGRGDGDGDQAAADPEGRPALQPEAGQLDGNAHR